ncbi:MAG: 30S ribosome-binding factor RbfA [Planctomycetia bacterium]|nr:30S ribosome-binding factor RbfA [Planctomycetia bacterium]
MPSRRIAKVNQAILETLSSAMLFQLRDPRVKNVTILHVETTDDLRAAKVHIGVRGDEKVQSLTLHGLDSARGFLQSKIAERLDTRNTPVLKFVLEPNWLASLTETSADLHVAEATVSEANAAIAEADGESDDHGDESDDDGEFGEDDDEDQ